MKFFKVLSLLILSCQVLFAGLDVPPVDKEGDDLNQSSGIPSLTVSPEPKKNTVILYKKNRKFSAQATIAAIVNGTPISVKDLNNKLKLVLKVPLEKLSSAEKDKINQQVLNMLIDELLKIQTTEKLGIKAEEKDIESAIDQIEKQNNFPKNGFRKMLKQKGIPEKIFLNSIKADLLWRQYVSAWAGNSLELDKKELKEIIAPDSKEGMQYHLAEIEVYTSPGESDEKSLESITKVLNQLKAKQPFVMLAHTQSHSPSASRGGDIGWIDENLIDPDVLEVIRELEPGQVSSPIPTEQGYKILLIVDKKDTSALQPTLTARQIEIKVPEEVSKNQEALAEKMEKLNKLVKTIATCVEFDQLSDQIPDSRIDVYKSVRLNELSRDLQTVVKDLKTGVPSKAIFNSANNTIVFFLVCERNEMPAEKTRSIEGIANQISNQRFMSISDQKLKEAKRVASIEIRI